MDDYIGEESENPRDSPDDIYGAAGSYERLHQYGTFPKTVDPFQYGDNKDTKEYHRALLKQTETLDKLVTQSIPGYGVDVVGKKPTVTLIEKVPNTESLSVIANNANAHETTSQTKQIMLMNQKAPNKGATQAKEFKSLDEQVNILEKVFESNFKELKNLESHKEKHTQLLNTSEKPKPQPQSSQSSASKLVQTLHKPTQKPQTQPSPTSNKMFSQQSLGLTSQSNLPNESQMAAILKATSSNLGQTSPLPSPTLKLSPPSSPQISSQHSLGLTSQSNLLNESQMKATSSNLVQTSSLPSPTLKLLQPSSTLTSSQQSLGLTSQSKLPIESQMAEILPKTSSTYVQTSPQPTPPTTPLATKRKQHFQLPKSPRRVAIPQKTKKFEPPNTSLTLVETESPKRYHVNESQTMRNKRECPTSPMAKNGAIQLIPRSFTVKSIKPIYKPRSDADVLQHVLKDNPFTPRNSKELLRNMLTEKPAPKLVKHLNNCEKSIILRERLKQAKERSLKRSITGDVGVGSHRYVQQVDCAIDNSENVKRNNTKYIRKLVQKDQTAWSMRHQHALPLGNESGDHPARRRSCRVSNTFRTELNKKIAWLLLVSLMVVIYTAIFINAKIQLTDIWEIIKVWYLPPVKTTLTKPKRIAKAARLLFGFLNIF